MRAQEKARPSRNTGNSRTTTDSRCTSTLSDSGVSGALRNTPNGALRPSSASRSFRKRVRETIAAPSGSAASSATVAWTCSAKAPSVMSGIHLVQIGHVLERLHADAAVGVEEAFAGFAQFQIGVDDAFHRRANLMGGKARSHYRADGSVLSAGAAELQLVIFHALLVDAKNADVACVVMAAGVDAAGNLDLEFADIVLAVEIGEALGDVLRNGNGARIGEIAIIKARASNDVCHQPRIRCRQIQLLEPRVDRRQIAFLDMWQHKILFVADANFVDPEFVHQVGEGIELFVARIAGNAPDRLQRNSGDGVTGRAMRVDVGFLPVLEIGIALWYFIGKQLEFRWREVGRDTG